ncbi:DUF1275 domain-containing protein [bacterium]|nr:DUF1275 domain-containing protein [bacterium]
MKKDKIVEIVTMALFTISSGFVDAYSFICRGGLFVTMQTGNIIKFFIELTKGNFILIFLLPIIFFVLGCVLSILLSKNKYNEIIVILSLLLSTIISGLCPNTGVYNLICVSILSFVFAMQFQVFRSCLSTNYTSTMCTNNLRLMSEKLVEKDKTFFLYLSVIICFSIGCVLGTLFYNLMNYYSVIVLSAIYLIILIIRFPFKKDKTIDSTSDI